MNIYSLPKDSDLFFSLQGLLKDTQINLLYFFYNNEKAKLYHRQRR